MKKTLLSVLMLPLSMSSFAIDITFTDSQMSVSNSNTDVIAITIGDSNQYSETFNFSGSSASISNFEINSAQDGLYKYSVIATSIAGSTEVSDNNGRNQVEKNIVTSETESGHIRIEDGQFLLTAEAE
ncbi:hypothetical protein NBRC116188_18700 [Oceaniserpentilla sp. 4NH20-0058]|uniref:hypothetical protein n=1 Tax=Oceaniserpentilla sp. 4NH20-0058 TaxID=3127660 RepID=UPI003108240C